MPNINIYYKDKIICRKHIEDPECNTLEEYRKSLWGYSSFKDQPNVFPCCICDGKGWIYHPDSEPDVVEGNKMRDTMQCVLCRGKKTGDKTPHVRYFHDMKKKYHTSVKKLEEDISKLKIILDNLSEDEFKLLKKYFNDNDFLYTTTSKGKVQDIHIDKEYEIK